MFRSRARGQQVGLIAQRLFHLHRLHLPTRVGRADASQLQQVADKRQLLHRPLLGLFERFAHLGLRDVAFQDQLKIALDGRDRRAELVRHQQRELGAHILQLDQLGVGMRQLGVQPLQILAATLALGVGEAQLLVEIAHLLGAVFLALIRLSQPGVELGQLLAAVLALGIGGAQLFVQLAHVARAHLQPIVGPLKLGVRGIQMPALVAAFQAGGVQLRVQRTQLGRADLGCLFAGGQFGAPAGVTPQPAPRSPRRSENRWWSAQPVAQPRMSFGGASGDRTAPSQDCGAAILCIQPPITRHRADWQRSRNRTRRDVRAAPPPSSRGGRGRGKKDSRRRRRNAGAASARSDPARSAHAAKWAGSAGPTSPVQSSASRPAAPH